MVEAAEGEADEVEPDESLINEEPVARGIEVARLNRREALFKACAI